MIPLTISVRTRFWFYTTKSDEGCWLWTGSTNMNGYGRLAIDSKGHYVVAHRVSWEIHHEPIPDNKMVLHRCDNRLCVRPDHLYVGTAKDNATDREERGRSADRQGIRHPLARLTEQDVSEIITLRDSGLKLQDIADRYGVSDSTISAIIHSKRWAHFSF